MKKLNLLLGIITLSILTLTSCEGNTDRYRHIQNNSSNSISIFASGSDYYEFEFQENLEAGQSVMFYNTNQMGGSETIENPATGIDSLLIINSEGDTCKKDFTIENNWETKVEHRRKVPSDWQHNYTLTIDDSDF
jgi:hypothetical protein